MIKLNCPKCQSEVEIDDQNLKDSRVTGVFCSNPDCTFHKDPLVGVDRKGHDGQEAGVYISEALL